MDVTRRVALNVAGGAMLGACASIDASPQDAGEASSSDLSLWYEAPAQRWVEALPVGNGRMGAMVFGGAGVERLQLNEDTLWAGGPYDPANPDALEALPEVRRLVFDGAFEEAQRLITAKVMAKPLRQMSYQTIGDLRLRLDGVDAVAGYRRGLDLDGALAVTRFTANGATWTRSVFASAVDQMIAIDLTCDQPGRIDLDATFAWPTEPATSAIPASSPAPPLGFEARGASPEGLVVEIDSLGDLVMRGRNAGQHGVDGALSWEARARVQTFGGARTAAGGVIQLRGADRVIIRLTMATSHRNFGAVDHDPAEANRFVLARGAGRPWEQMLADHQADHRRLFRRVSIDLGRTAAADLPTDRRVRDSQTSDDPALAALYYQFGRYFLIACSRPGSQPANLQGLWNDRLSPPWGSKYTININTQMNYWPAEPTGLGECVRPLIEMVKDLAVTGARTARTMYGARGWVAHHNVDIWRASAPVDGVIFGMWPTGGAWLCQHLWDRWDYTRDQSVLAEIYPVLKGAALFFLDTLQPHPNGRWLVTNPSLSPENLHRRGVAIACGPAIDSQILRDLFDHAQGAALLLGVDAELQARFKAARDRLPPDQIGAQGQLQEWLEDWDATAVDPQHRHVSHLYGVYPSGQISLDATPELAAAAMHTLNVRGDDATGWGIGWRLNLWARLRDAARAHAILKLLLGPERTYPNLFDAHPPFQIDGNFGGVSGITEMLVQSLAGETDGGDILLLPALPAAWPNGRLTGVRGRGALTVDLVWAEGQLAEARLQADRAGTWRVRVQGQSHLVSLRSGEVAKFSMRSGEIVSVT